MKILVNKKIKFSLVKVISILVGYSIWFIISQNELITTKFPIEIIISDKVKKQIIDNKLYNAEVEVTRKNAFNMLLNKFKLFFDTDNLKKGLHELETGSGLFISDFETRILRHDLPDKIKCKVDSI